MPTLRIYRIVATLAVAFFFGCVTAKYIEEVPDERLAKLRAKQRIYQSLVMEQLDEHGLWVDKASIGDSALFSCLARVGGATAFNPAILFTKDGKPVRHPDIYLKQHAKTPISRDMVTGILWCLMDMEDRIEARTLIAKMINYGRTHTVKLLGNEVGWSFCDKQDREIFKISETDFVGRCVMTPVMVKNIYVTAEWLGVPCDDDCNKYKFIGIDVGKDLRSYHRHLAVLNTMRGGIINGSVPKRLLEGVLRTAAKEKNNGLYLAALARFSDGNMDLALNALLDEKHYPMNRLPTKHEHCNNYLFSREEYEDVEIAADEKGCINYKETSDELKSDCGYAAGEKDFRYSYSEHWLPCPDTKQPDRGYGVDFLFAAAVVLNELPNDALEVRE